MVGTMHGSEPVPTIDLENGLPALRWRVSGFLTLREHGMLDRHYEYELVDGIILHHGLGSPLHGQVVDELVARLRPHWKGSVATGQELRLDEHDAVVRPDVVVCDGFVPELVVEVSEDAPRLDGLEKARLYARIGVANYWHVDLAWKHVKIHRWPHADGSWGMTLSGPPDHALHTGLLGLEEITLDELLEAAVSA
jgi:Uma2 family endonuclease